LHARRLLQNRNTVRPLRLSFSHANSTRGCRSGEKRPGTPQAKRVSYSSRASDDGKGDRADRINVLISSKAKKDLSRKPGGAAPIGRPKYRTSPKNYGFPGLIDLHHPRFLKMGAISRRGLRQKQLFKDSFPVPRHSRCRKCTHALGKTVSPHRDLDHPGRRNVTPMWTFKKSIQQRRRSPGARARGRTGGALTPTVCRARSVLWGNHHPAKGPGPLTGVGRRGAKRVREQIMYRF